MQTIFSFKSWTIDGVITDYRRKNAPTKHRLRSASARSVDCNEHCTTATLIIHCIYYMNNLRGSGLPGSGWPAAVSVWRGQPGYCSQVQSNNTGITNTVRQPGYCSQVQSNNTGIINTGSQPGYCSQVQSNNTGIINTVSQPGYCSQVQSNNTGINSGPTRVLQSNAEQ
jgi:hypothetical protein